MPARCRSIDLLDPQAGDRVLDVGCGPGYAIVALVRRVCDGCVVGLDHSGVMIAQARRRNRRAASAGRAELVLGSYVDLPDLGARFDRMLAVNSLMFSRDPAGTLAARDELMMRPASAACIRARRPAVDEVPR